MKITDRMVVADSIGDEDADVRLCKECNGFAFYTPQKVMVLSRSGARSMRLWSCESHRLPEQITDEEDT